MLASFFVKSCFLAFLALIGLAFGFALLNRSHDREVERSYRSGYRPDKLIRAVVACTKQITDKTIELVESVQECFEPRSKMPVPCRPAHSIAVAKKRASR